MTIKDYKKKEIIQRRIKRGDSMHDIAMSMGVDKSTVSRWAKKLNIRAINKFPGNK